MTANTLPLHVAAVITPHGFGHAAITIAVLTALEARIPQGIDVTFITKVPATVIAERWGRPCRVIDHAAATDFGMVMRSSTDISVTESLAAYATAHARWDDVVETEAAIMAEVMPDIVLTSASYAALAGARRVGVPGVGVGPFSWREILAAYSDDSPITRAVLTSMAQTYAEADAFIATAPAVPMDLPNLRPVGPVGQPGRSRREELAAALELEEGERVALVALGGIAEDLPVSDWPRVDGWRCITPKDIALSVSDAIASCDAVITKPGYGTFVEAVCAGTPLLYRDRPDWPETAGMAKWASAHVPCLHVDPATFAAGRIEEHLRMLMQIPPGPRAKPQGNHQAAEIIVDLVSIRGIRS
ncbi:MAG: hypothetical protein WCZ23_07635 [Rhodospirillaceae bacterium]